MKNLLTSGLRQVQLLILALLAGIAATATASAQYACTTNYCIQSQSVAFETPPGWPAVPVESCCRTHWGALPGAIDWARGAPIMVCTSTPEYVTAFPNCGDPANLSQAFPLSYEKPRIAIGIAWPNPKDYRYEMQSVPLVDGSDGTCARFSHQPGKVSSWWVYELPSPKQGSYVFTAALSFRQGDNGYHAVLDRCSLTPPGGPGR